MKTFNIIMYNSLLPMRLSAQAVALIQRATIVEKPNPRVRTFEVPLHYPWRQLNQWTPLLIHIEISI